ncbi:uncharacterized protein LOC135499559 isoform X2 [Lineus longissimus]
MATMPPTKLQLIVGKRITTYTCTDESMHQTLLQFLQKLFKDDEIGEIGDDGFLSDMSDAPTPAVEPSICEPQPTFHTKAEREIIERSLEEILKRDGPNAVGKTVVRKNLAMGVIGKDGGILSFVDKDVTMEIPPGALEEATIIYCFWPITNADRKRPEADLAFFAPTIDCGPDGTTFSKFITLKTKHCITEMDRQKTEMLNVFTRDGINPKWREDTDASFETDGEWVVLKTKHFSDFTLARRTEMSRDAEDKGRCVVDAGCAMVLPDFNRLPAPLVGPIEQLINYLTSTLPVMQVQPHDTSLFDIDVSLGVTKSLLRRDGPNELLGKVLKGSNYSVSVIGPKGGCLAFLDGSVTMDIPQGALREPEVIHCCRPRTETGGKESNDRFVSYAPSITCGPHGTKFDKDVTLRVKHHISADEPDKMNGLDIFTRSKSQLEWEKDAAGSFRVEGEWAILTTNHFSEFTIGAREGRQVDLPRRDILVSTAITTRHGNEENKLNLHIFFASSNRNQMHQFLFEVRSSLSSRSVEVFELDTERWERLSNIQDQTLISTIIGKAYVVNGVTQQLTIPASVLRALPTSAHAIQFQIRRSKNNHPLICLVDISQYHNSITELDVDRQHHHHQQQAQQ